MAEAPENTASSFKKALSYPIDGIELDIQITRDGVPVIFHDKYIDKKSDGSGRVSDYTYPELSRFDWGAWFSDDYRGENILTLNNVLTYYGNRTRLFIEIKSAPNPNKAFLYSQLPGLITQLIRQLIPVDLLGNIFILSFDQILLASAYENDPKLQYVLNIETAAINRKELILDINKLYGFCLAFSKLTPVFIAWCHQNNKKVITYSCNTTRRIQRAFDLNIDVIMTDDPGAVVGAFTRSKKDY